MIYIARISVICFIAVILGFFCRKVDRPLDGETDNVKQMRYAYQVIVNMARVYNTCSGH